MKPRERTGGAEKLLKGRRQGQTATYIYKAPVSDQVRFFSCVFLRLAVKTLA